MHLVNDENDVSAGFYLGNETFHTAFKLSAELRACDQRGQIEQINLLVAELKGDVACDNTLGKSFRDGCLADARLADQTGIVLLAAVQDLYDAFRLDLAPDDLIHCVGARFPRQTETVGVQKLMFFALGLVRLRLFRFFL